MFDNCKADFERYTEARTKSILKVITQPGLWAILIYRFGSWSLRQRKFPVFYHILRISHVILKVFIAVLSGILISERADIGPGFYITHFGCIIIGCYVKIGKNCHIFQEVTIGAGGRESYRGIPKIGDKVYIGAGAKVIGDVIIGNNVAIGANAVVTKSFPENCVIGGVPAKIIYMEDNIRQNR